MHELCTVSDWSHFQWENTMHILLPLLVRPFSFLLPLCFILHWLVCFVPAVPFLPRLNWNYTWITYCWVLTLFCGLYMDNFSNSSLATPTAGYWSLHCSTVPFYIAGEWVSTPSFSYHEQYFWVVGYPCHSNWLIRCSCFADCAITAMRVRLYYCILTSFSFPPPVMSSCFCSLSAI